MKYTMLIAVALATAGPAVAQTSADSAAIRATALDYIDGYYTGNAERMERALHPDLVKRIVVEQGEGTMVQGMTAAQLIEGTRRGGASAMPAANRRSDVQITGIYGRAATVTIDATDWVDYLHIGKVDGRWVIINVLWEMRPEALERMRRGQSGV
jgi:hypothetical protein